MTSRERLLAALEHRATDRVPVELEISPEARRFPEAARVVRFIQEEADNFVGVGGIDWGFCGLDASYHEELTRESEEYLWKQRTYVTPVGDFVGITRHRKDELVASDFHWEQRYVHCLDDLARLAEAPRAARPLDRAAFDSGCARVGERGLPMVGLFHALGWLVRNATMEEVYIWLATEPAVSHRFLAATTRQAVETVRAALASGVGPLYGVTAHEMLIPPWMGERAFRELVLPYDREMYAAVHRGGGRVRAHCHGNCMGFLILMADMGIDSIEPLEEPPFGDVLLPEAKRLVGDRMLLSGNVASNLFVRMSVPEVREAVRRAIREGSPGGGFTLKTTGGHAGTNAVKSREQMILLIERIEAYMDAALEGGGRP